MGLNEILEEINRESDQEYNEAVDAAKLENNKLIVEAMEEIEKKKVAENKSLELELKRRRIKLKAKAELDVYRERQKLEVNLINNLLEESFSEVLKYLKQNRKVYIKFMVRFIRASIELIGAKPVYVSFNRDDRSLFGDLTKEFGTGVIKPGEDVKISGGVICSGAGIYIDNSLENIFENKRPDFLKMIYEELNK